MVRIKKVLVANRSEIALRIIKTLKRLNIIAVAVYDDREKNTQYVQQANEAYSLGDGSLSDTFLNISKIINIAKISGCDAVHPGYGFLSENAFFAQQCIKNNMVFIGPSVENLRQMGDKTEALLIAQQLGLPVIPGIRGTISEIIKKVDHTIFPCIIKASAGGGGKGMRVANKVNELTQKMRKVAGEAKRYFSNPEVLIEKYLPNTRHVEVQVLGDKHGNVVHLFERECSLQRRYQKIIEEAPCTSISSILKEKLQSEAVKLAMHIGYCGAGTVEFLVNDNGDYFFLEMNPRIQVEHPVTEMITGIDIVEQQINIARGEVLDKSLSTIKANGHAIEVRLNAEDPENDFIPSSGKITNFFIPELTGVRCDVNVRVGETVISDFDSMMAKVIVHGANRIDAINLLKDVLSRTVVQGVKHNLAFLHHIACSANFSQLRFSTSYIDNLLPYEQTSELLVNEKLLLIAAGLLLDMWHNQIPENIKYIGPWRMLNDLQVFLDGVMFRVTQLEFNKTTVAFKYDNVEYRFKHSEISNGSVLMERANYRERVFFSEVSAYGWYLSIGIRNYLVEMVQLNKRKPMLDSTKSRFERERYVTAPLSGKLLKVNVKPGQRITKGNSIVVIESMKMENEVRLPFDSVIRNVLIDEGTRITEGDRLIELVLT